jgi:hypothetical protein
VEAGDDGGTPTASADREVADRPRAVPWSERGGHATFFATTFVGSGLRFNNPYRLATPLGQSAESLSRTATYGDIGLGATFGSPRWLEHGAALRLSFSLEGVQQSVLTPAYLAYRRFTAAAVFGRIGTPFVLTPERTFGLEASVGAVYFLRAGIGVAAEVVGNVFYGEGTREVGTATYPVLSGQVGLLVAYEVLP